MTGDRWATFDCYGTLIDWNGGIRRELARVFGEDEADERLDRYHELEAALQIGGARSYREVMTDAMRKLGAPDDEVSGLAEALPFWEPFPEVRPALEDARSRGWKLAILSNTDRDFIDASMMRIGVPFELAIVASEIGSYKPGQALVAFLRRDRRAARNACACRSESLPRHRSGERARTTLDLDQPLRRTARSAAHTRARRSFPSSPHAR